jgi:hypothetical protein
MLASSCVCEGAGEAAVGERAEPGGGVRQVGTGGGARSRLHLTRHHHHRARGLHRGRPQGRKPFNPLAVNQCSRPVFTESTYFWASRIRIH